MGDDRWLYALALASVASGVAGLLVPLYLVRLGAGAPALGVSAALSSLVGAPGAVFVGRYADRTGRRRGPVLASLAVAALAVAALPLLPSIPGVIALNAVLWFAVAAVAPVLTMLAVGGVPEGRWNERIARLNTYQGYGSTAGLVLGAAWTGSVARLSSPAFAQESLFALSAAIAAVSVLMAARSLPAESSLPFGPRRSARVTAILARTNRRVRDATFAFGGNRLFWALRSSPGALRRVARDLPTVLAAYFGGAFLFFVGFAVFWAPLPLYLTAAGFASGPVFALYLVNNVASTVLFEGAGRVSAAHDVRLVQAGALGLRAAAFVAVSLLGVLGVGALAGGAVDLLAVGGLLAVVGVTWAFIAVTGTTIVSRFAPDRSRGSVLGTYAALSAVAGSAGSLAGGWLARGSFRTAFLAAGALVIAGGLVVLATRRLAAARPASPDGGGERR